mmetsp:Transcript_13545/g.50412  ORF Transcript_13545/g.50412 Transcript_13545/m.50412 type:complete len:240 (-) Transcript_13545:1357-2076(-)
MVSIEFGKPNTIAAALDSSVALVVSVKNTEVFSRSRPYSFEWPGQMRSMSSMQISRRTERKRLRCLRHSRRGLPSASDSCSLQACPCFGRALTQTLMGFSGYTTNCSNQRHASEFATEFRRGSGELSLVVSTSSRSFSSVEPGFTSELISLMLSSSTLSWTKTSSATLIGDGLSTGLRKDRRPRAPGEALRSLPRSTSGKTSVNSFTLSIGSEVPPSLTALRSLSSSLEIRRRSTRSAL